MAEGGLSVGARGRTEGEVVGGSPPEPEPEVGGTRGRHARAGWSVRRRRAWVSRVPGEGTPKLGGV